MDVNVKERHVNGMKTLQLETLGASAIQCFDKVGTSAKESLHEFCSECQMGGSLECDV